jgi:hypothetical protein
VGHAPAAKLLTLAAKNGIAAIAEKSFAVEIESE